MTLAMVSRTELTEPLRCIWTSDNGKWSLWTNGRQYQVQDRDNWGSAQWPLRIGFGQLAWENPHAVPAYVQAYVNQRIPYAVA
jgi:hypothetical protein